jgi:hypothetical protein
MTWYGVSHVMERQPEPLMNAFPTNASEPLDRKTSRSICDAVAERLQRDLRPQSLATPSPYLQGLLDQLHRQDAQSGSGAR